MDFSNKKQRVKFLSRVVILLSVSFLVGEVFGLYSISQLKSDLDAMFNTLHTEQSIIRKLGKMLWFYLPCLLPLIHCRWFIVVPVVLFCRGYLLGCSLAAISYMNADDIGNLVGMMISAGVHTMSLTVLSSNLFYYLLVKRKHIFGNTATERQTVFKSIIFALFSIVICCFSELLIHH